MHFHKEAKAPEITNHNRREPTMAELVKKNFDHPDEGLDRSLLERQISAPVLLRNPLPTS
jgi:hypothetical protein